MHKKVVANIAGVIWHCWYSENNSTEHPKTIDCAKIDATLPCGMCALQISNSRQARCQCQSLSKGAKQHQLLRPYCLDAVSWAPQLVFNQYQTCAYFAC